MSGATPALATSDSSLSDIPPSPSELQLIADVGSVGIDASCSDVHVPAVACEVWRSGQTVGSLAVEVEVVRQVVGVGSGMQ